MAQRSITTDGMTMSIATSTFSSNLTQLKNALDNKEIIEEIHISSLKDLYNIWIDHTHAVQDYYYIRYGDKYKHNTTRIQDRTSSVLNGSKSTAATSGIIYASHVTQLINLINSKRTHTHVIHDDSY